MEVSNCDVCASQQHRYKCPTCTVKYCSASCFKSHKQAEEGKESLCSSRQQSLPKAKKEFPSAAADEFDAEDEHFVRVPDDRLTRLKVVVHAVPTNLNPQQAKLRQFLSHSKLAKLVRDINALPLRGSKR